MKVLAYDLTIILHYLLPTTYLSTTYIPAIVFEKKPHLYLAKTNTPHSVNIYPAAFYVYFAMRYDQHHHTASSRA